MCFFFQVQDKNFNIEGRRIVDIAYFLNQLVKISTHASLFNCKLSNLQSVEEVQMGLNSKIFFKCNMCMETFCIFTCEDVKDDMNVTDSMVSGIVTIGAGFSNLQELTAVVGIPCMSSRQYSKSHEKACEWWDRTKVNAISEAAQEEAELAKVAGDVDKDGVPMITVVADGCWSKRSYKTKYAALSGAAVIVGYRTKKVLYMGVKNKFCMTCTRASNRSVSPPIHKCYKNYVGSSSGMESEIIVEGFKSSLDTQGIIYSKLIADGDCSTYKKILEARPYPNITVEKIECRNHLLRNYITKINLLSLDTQYPISLRKIISNRLLRLRRSITSAINHRISESGSTDSKIRNLNKDIINSIKHVFGDHITCDDYYCNRADEKSYIQDLKSCNLFSKLSQHCSRLASHSRSLIYNVDSNIAETYNSVVAKMVGGKRINFSTKQSYAGRCAAAVVAFNTKRPHYVLHKTVFDNSPRNILKRFEANKVRIRNRQIQQYKRRTSNKPQQSSQPDSEYGEACQKPDMDDVSFNAAKQQFLNDLKCSTPERRRIERETILQSENGEWLERRRNLLTASWFGKVCKRRSISCAPLVKSLLYGRSLQFVDSIKYGKINEPIAIQQLCEQESITIEQSGLFIDPEQCFLGATPDGLYGNNTIIEIKCPSSAKGMTVHDAIVKKKITFWKLFEKKYRVNQNHDWYFQVQGQLHISNKRSCILAVWTGSNFPLKVEYILRDDKFWEEKMKMKLTHFYMDCILPELIDPRVTRSMKVREPSYILSAAKRPLLGKRRLDFDSVQGDEKLQKK